ncbi:MAG: CDP-glycerol glycerophosphotransferase family protein [Patescibacteria group bacterium]
MTKIKKLIAFLLAPIFRLFKKNEIWIMGASQGKKFTDNGAVLYRYLLENKPEINTYWIINKDSPDLSKVKKTGPFVYKNTIKGNIYVLLADVLITTHNIHKDFSAYSVDKYKDKFKVFISHGIEGLKIKAPHHAKVHKIYDLSIAVSEFEKEIKVNEWGLEEDKICVTNLPRYDVLDKHKNKKTEEVKQIFYMPTWCPEYRKTFDQDYSDLTNEQIEEFKNREYFQKISTFISHPELAKLLEEEDIKMDVFFHQSINPFMSKIIKQSPCSERVSILSNGSHIQQKLINADILISDYSSVVWDFLYMNKPTIFYQFDQEKHLQTTGTYIDVPADLFGPVTKSPEENIEKIKEIIEEDNYKSKRKKIKNKFFKYDDDNNCKRLINAILEKKKN